MKALIVVDMQRDFMPDGSLPVPEGYEIVPTINKLMSLDTFDFVVATKDWHPEDHKSFASNNEDAEVGDIIELDGLDQIMWPDHCVQRTKGSLLVDEMHVDKVDHIHRKGTDPNIDSYSAFYDNAHRKETGLSEYLKMKGIDTVYVCGVATDYCVKFTVLDAIEEGFKTYLIEDATKGVDMEDGDVEKALEEMEKKGAILTEAELI